MSATFGLVGTTPLADYTTGNDLEDVVYRDIGDKWSLTGDLSKTNVFGTTVKADMINKPHQFRPAWVWVQHRRTESSRTAGPPTPGFLGGSIGKTGYISYRSTLNIRIFYKRFTSPGLTFPELGQMAREVEKILYQYPLSNPPEVMGVQQFDNVNIEPIEEASNLGEAFRGWYQILIMVDAMYQKRSTI